MLTRYSLLAFLLILQANASTLFAAEPASEPKEKSAEEYYRDAGHWYRFDRPTGLSGGAYRCLAESFYGIDEIIKTQNSIYPLFNAPKRQYTTSGISPPSLSETIEQLRNENPEARLAAAVSLFEENRLWWVTELDDTLRDKVEIKAVESLRQKLRDESQTIRTDAVRSLFCLRSPSALGALIDMLEDKDYSYKDDIVQSVRESVNQWSITKSYATFSQQLQLKDAGPSAWTSQKLAAYLKSIAGFVPSEFSQEASGDSEVDCVSEKLYSWSSDVGEWIRGLRDDDWKIRSQCALYLGRARAEPRMTGPLIFALRDDMGEVRAAAARSLGQLGDRRAIEPLFFALRDEELKVRAAAIESLGRFGDDRAFEPAMKLARCADGDERLSAFRALAYFAKPESIDLLVAALDEENDQIRRVAIEALCSLDDPKVTEALARFLYTDADADIRFETAAVLIKRNDPACLNWLLESLEDRDFQTQMMAYTVFVQWKDPRSLVPLLRIAGRNRWFAMAAVMQIEREKIREKLRDSLDSEDRDIRAGAVLSIGGFGEKDAIDKILDMIDTDDPLMRQNVIWTLMQLGDRRAVPLLISELKRDFAWTRIDAAMALGRLGDPRAVEPLTVALTDDDPLLRRAAAVALGMIGDRRAVASLIEAIDDKDSKVAAEVARSLVIIGDERATEAILSKVRSKDFPSIGLVAALFATGWRPTSTEDVVNLLISLNSKGLLVEVASHSTPHLVKLLESDDASSRYFATETLIRIGDERTIPAITEMFRKHPTDQLSELLRSSFREELVEVVRSWKEEISTNANDWGYCIPSSGVNVWGGKAIELREVPYNYGYSSPRQSSNVNQGIVNPSSNLYQVAPAPVQASTDQADQ